MGCDLIDFVWRWIRGVWVWHSTTLPRKTRGTEIINTDVKNSLNPVREQMQAWGDSRHYNLAQ